MFKEDFCIVLPVTKEFNGIFFGDLVLLYGSSWESLRLSQIWLLLRCPFQLAAITLESPFQLMESKRVPQAPKATMNALRPPYSFSYIYETYCSLYALVLVTVWCQVWKGSVFIFVVTVSIAHRELCSLTLVMAADNSLRNCDLIDVLKLKTNPLTGFCDTEHSFSNSTSKSGVSSDLPDIPTNGEMDGIV